MHENKDRTFYMLQSNKRTISTFTMKHFTVVKLAIVIERANDLNRQSVAMG